MLPPRFSPLCHGLHSSAYSIGALQSDFIGGRRHRAAPGDREVESTGKPRRVTCDTPPLHTIGRLATKLETYFRALPSCQVTGEPTHLVELGVLETPNTSAQASDDLVTRLSLSRTDAFQGLQESAGVSVQLGNPGGAGLDSSLEFGYGHRCDHICSLRLIVGTPPDAHANPASPLPPGAQSPFHPRPSASGGTASRFRSPRWDRITPATA